MSRTTYRGRRGGRNARVRRRVKPYHESLQTLGREKKRCRKSRGLSAVRGAGRFWRGPEHRRRKR